MALGVFSRLGRVRVTVAYAAILVAVSVVLLILGPYVQDRVLRHASTNLHNLAHGHFGTLLGSAFVVEAGPMWVWLPGMICLLAVCETLFGSVRLIVAFAVGHIGATLLVAAGLAVAVESHWQEASVARAIDVGMSYGTAGALGALTGAVPGRWRWHWVAWWVAVALVAIAVERDFTNVGHAVALMLGMTVSTRFGPAHPWTPMRRVVAVPGVGFGVLMLANTTESMLVAAGAGTLAVATVAVIQRKSSAPASIQSDRQDSGAGSSSSSPGVGHS
jgi:hypothetical protein